MGGVADKGTSSPRTFRVFKVLILALTVVSFCTLFVFFAGLGRKPIKINAQSSVQYYLSPQTFITAVGCSLLIAGMVRGTQQLMQARKAEWHVQCNVGRHTVLGSVRRTRS